MCTTWYVRPSGALLSDRLETEDSIGFVKAHLYKIGNIHFEYFLGRLIHKNTIPTMGMGRALKTIFGRSISMAFVLK